MAKDNKIQMPGAFGGLMRYDAEFKSRFQFSPIAIIAFVIAIIIFVIAIKIFFPVQQPVNVGGSGIPFGPSGVSWVLIY